MYVSMLRVPLAQLEDMCLRAPADWDVFSAIKAFPHMSISNLQELERPLDFGFYCTVCLLDNLFS